MALTLLALVSFALNSLLCRAALGPNLIDASTFTLVRLGSGAVVLFLVAKGTPGARPASPGSMAASASALFLYALPFTLAYRKIPAGTGAFVLFCCVQITMIGADLVSGRRLRARECTGLGLAVLGLLLLTRPGLQSPDLPSVGLMATAGVAWGVYSLRGRTSGPALPATARNFAAALPLAAVASALTLSSAHATWTGFGLAAISGGVTSGLGYVAWYSALTKLSPTRAAIVQLSVPPLASFLAIPLLGEALTPRLLIAAPLIVFGIALAILKPAEGPATVTKPVGDHVGAE